MIFSRNPPLMEQAVDTPPELSPIFSFLNIHTNKVYQEGYFLKLNDQDTCECFLSLSLCLTDWAVSRMRGTL